MLFHHLWTFIYFNPNSWNNSLACLEFDMSNLYTFSPSCSLKTDVQTPSVMLRCVFDVSDSVKVHMRDKTAGVCITGSSISFT